MIACFPVYRTYAQADSTDVSAGDRAAHPARDPRRQAAQPLHQRVDVRLHRRPLAAARSRRAVRRRPRRAARVRAAPAAADRPGDGQGARGHGLLSLLPAGVAQRGRRAAHRRRRRPATLPRAGTRAASPSGRTRCRPRATHDTKRGEDVRARLDVLSEIPREWQRRPAPLAAPEPAAQVASSTTCASPSATRSTSSTRRWSAPGRWTRSTRDLTDAAREALRERIARVHDQGAARGEAAHELDQRQRALRARASRSSSICCLQPSGGERVPRRAAPVRGRILIPGICNSLAQLVLKITAPGVPDFYQGTELWDLSLVDPDNRRPVDFAARRALVAELTGRGEAALPELVASLLRRPGDGRDQAARDHPRPRSIGGAAAPSTTAAGTSRWRWRAPRTPRLRVRANAGRNRVADGGRAAARLARACRRGAGRRGQLDRHADRPAAGVAAWRLPRRIDGKHRGAGPRTVRARAQACARCSPTSRSQFSSRPDRRTQHCLLR